MYESTVIPMETMRPVIPARSKLGLMVWPNAEMMAHSNAAVSTDRR